MKYALLSDIHEDLASLEKALLMIAHEGCDEIICLGDVLGFNPHFHKHHKIRDAAGCLDLIQKNCSILIPGNHDLYAIEKLPQPGPGFHFPENWYALSIAEREKIGAGKVWLYNDGEAQTKISDKHREWLAGLPEIQVVESRIGNILISHYAYPNLNGALTQFYHKTKAFQAHKALMEDKACPFSFIGHLHHPGLLISSGRIKRKGFNRSYRLKKGDCIAVPPVVDTGSGGSFCIFNTEDQTVMAKLYR